MPSAVANMQNSLKVYLDQYKDLVNQTAISQQKADAQTWQFVSERQAGEKGELPSFPTIQDTTIFLFWLSIFILFYFLASSNSILSGVSLYIFPIGVISVIIAQFFNNMLAIILLVITLIYFLTVSVKAFGFFIGFLVTCALIQITIYLNM